MTRLRLALALLAPFPIGAAAQSLPVVRPEEIGLSAPALAKIAPALRAHVERGHLPGFVAVVARHGKVGYLEAIGTMDVAAGTPMRTDAVFRIFSMTKPVIAAAVLRLADQGKLRLDDPVARYVPGFAATRVYDGGPAARPRLRAPDRPMTVVDLLTHTAGLTYGFFGQTPVDSIVTASGVLNDAMTLEQFADSLARLPLLFSPGTGWNYSVSIDLAGRVVEVASGRPLDRYLAEEFFGPLGMRETGFRFRPETRDRVPTLYTAGPDGRLEPGPASLDESYLPTSRFLSGGGGLLSTPADYLRFAQMLLNRGELHGRRILSRESVARMMRNHLPPGLTPLSSPLVEHQGYGHGLGGVVLSDSVRADLPGSPGIYRWWGYAGTFFWIDPRADLIAMVWTQFIPGRTYPVERDFQRLVYAAIRR
jgi:CubicO group peptidase (beta-lactamase class C family)